MSTKPFERVVWIILDGMGFEHARLGLDSGLCPGLERMRTEGYLGASMPSTPACQTPSALMTLFSGAEPEQSGIWGYYMPDWKTRDGSISGFNVRPKDARTIWGHSSLREKGYSIMNVAFRKDPVWAGDDAGLDFGYDGYRLGRRTRYITLSGGSEELDVQGIGLRMRSLRDGIELRKGAARALRLRVGEGRIVDLTAGTRVYAFLLDRSLLGVAPLFKPMVRGRSVPAAMASETWELGVFARARRLNRSRPESEATPVEWEMVPAAESFRSKEELLLRAIGECGSRLVIGYFPTIDELNHAYGDLLETEWPSGRVSRLFLACAGLVDRLLTRVMSALGPESLLVVSSDHGSASYRGKLHLNELLAQEGTVQRSATGYDLSRSAMFYHPSESGLVIGSRRVERGTALRSLRRVLDRARSGYRAPIGMVEGRPDDPHLAFLYPLGDIMVDASPPRKGRGILDTTKSGGHHTSPLSPTPWIQAMLGLWSARTTNLAHELDGIPARNRDVKDFLIRLMGEG